MRIRSQIVLCAFSVSMLAACGGGEPCGGPGVICTFMGTGLAGLGKDGVHPEEVRLYLPMDLEFGPDGNPYVLDWNNHRVRTVTAEGLVQTVVGTGYLGDAPNGDARSASLNHPTDVTFDADGTMILSAWHNSKVARVDLSTGELTTFCGDGARSYRGDGGPAEDAWVDLPVSTVLDSEGRLYISDQGNQRIRMIDQDGIIDTVVGPPAGYIPEGQAEVCVTDEETMEETCKICKAEEAEDPACEAQPLGRPQGFGGDGGPATGALLSMPFGQRGAPAGRIEIGPDDTLYIADTGNQRIRAVTPDGIIDTVAGSGPDQYDPDFIGGYDGDGGPATEALLQRPVDMALDPDGNLYIADTGNSCIRRVDAETGIITTAAGVCGEGDFAGDGGPATEARLDRPYGVAFDADGNLYIADTHNHRIRVVYAE